MKIILEIDYGDKSYKQVESLLGEILDEFMVLFPLGPRLGHKDILVVLSDIDGPIAYSRKLPVKYEIGITPTEYYPLQITYQFAHELCHVFIDPRLTNWLIESFCECMSLVALEKLAITRQSNNPDWAEKYFQYINTTKKRHLKSLGLTENQIETNNYSSYNKSLTTPYNRGVNFINAWKIFNLYKVTPTVLNLVSYLHYSKNIETLGENVFIEEIHPNLSKFENNIPYELLQIWADLKENII
ncbi:hypothetical protein FFF34_002815 [Inquilinus sp. KBS0705]|nr:hypothetical protein FFF34_002815 [Inquilinus sp. KBS0705]